MPQMSERCERFAQRAPSASMVCCRKRHSQSDEPPEGPKSKKYLSEKMASWFKQLQITPVQQDGASALWGNSGQDSGWQRFCELEKRLEEDIEEADVDTPSDNQTDTSGEPRLVFAEGVDEILTPDPVLPEAIRNRITNPCMELVLYKEPGSLVRGSISEDTDTVRVIPDTRSSSESDQQSRDQQRSAEVTLGMTSTTQGRGVNGLVLNTTQMHRAPSDTEMFEMADDDMDL
ncbi:hypothetical protein BaRGS_00027224 [Batillaria attramentaria]|uniref:Uncharacterized protein n=1 Tax=Batillaria attramentaria TaxID=370345 RepID=A0ABD0K3K6_9CAEN